MGDPAEIWRTAYVHPAPWQQDFPPLTMAAMFDETSAQHSTKPIADFLGTTLSYGAIARDVARFATALQSLGLERGDRVGLFLPNVPDYLIAYYGALKAGMVVVNMSPLYSVPELCHQVEDSGTRTVITSDVPQLYFSAKALLDQGVIDRMIVGSLSAWLRPVKRALFRLFRAKERVAIANDDPRIIPLMPMLRSMTKPMVPVVIGPDDLALIQYTGGTTGVPKGAMLSHQNLTANARQVLCLDPHWKQGDRVIGVLPFFHVFANTGVLNRVVLAGGMIAMLPRFDPKATLATIERVRATALPGVPTMFQAILDTPEAATTDFSSLRVCVSGGAPLALPLKERFEALTGTRLFEGYGLTESSGVVACNPYDSDGKPGTIGQPVPGTLVRLVDRDDPSRPALPDGPGELVFDGPQVMKGYWGRPEADRDVFIGSALRTGDVATIDDEGFIRIVDRLKDMITVGGFKVFPSQVEEVLYDHPAVKEAIVIGVPDTYHGEMPKAFVTLNAGHPGETGDALMTWANERLGKHERVIAVEVRETLPRTLVGKLSRKELIEEERGKVAA